MAKSMVIEMSEYYAVIRSTDHLAHYGIKGMRWGVRRAVQSGNEKKLSRQYMKAMKKLSTLKRKADIKVQSEEAKKHNRRAGIALGVGLAGTGIHAGVRSAAKKVLEESGAKHLQELAEQGKSRKKNYIGQGKEVYKTGEGLGTGPVGNHPVSRMATNGTNLSNVQKSSGITARQKMQALAILSAAGLGTAAYQKGKAIAAKYRTTSKGHAKAVSDLNAWEREMRAAFKGTKYSEKRSKKNRSQKKRR